MTAVKQKEKAETWSDFQPLLRWQYRHLRPHLDHVRNSAEWEAGIVNDPMGEEELVYWTTATFAFVEYCHQHPRANPENVFRCLSGLLIGKNQTDKRSQELKRLFRKVPHELYVPSSFAPDGRFDSPQEHLR